MKKIEMARYVTKVLFNLDETVSPDHWKVKDLMKCSKPALEDFYNMAKKAENSRKYK